MTLSNLPISLAAALSMSLLGCAPTTPSKEATVSPNPDRDRVAVRSAVESIARNADLRQWDAVASAFDTRVELDYGTPEQLAPEDIVGRWRPLLSAFDTTQHVLRDVRVVVTGDTATAEAAFQATHSLDGDVWVLSGRYEWSARRTASGWKVTRMKMIPGESTGNAALLDRAKAKAASVSVTVTRAEFASDGDTLVATTYAPAAAKGKLPTVIVTGSWTTVKEQMAKAYAERLAAAGYLAITFDFRGFGESAGALRDVESPARKAADIRAAVTYALSRADVDAERVSLLGICASAGYAVVAATEDDRIHRVALVAPWLHDKALVEQVYGGSAGVAKRIRAGETAKRAYDKTGKIEYVTAASATDETAAMFGPATFLDYYLNEKRGAIPQWPNRFAVMAWPEWLRFDPIALAPKVDEPIAIVHSDTAAVPDGARRFARALKVPVKETWLPNKSQFDFYDDRATIDAAMPTVLAHLGGK